MRRAFITILLLLMPTVVFGQTSTVSGHVVYGSNSPVPSKAQACFSLQNFKPNLPRLSTGVIVTNTSYCITPAVDGSFSTPIARNDFITPAGTYWRVDYMYNGVQSSSANFLINKSSFNLDVEIPVNPTIIIGPSQLITQSFLYQQASPSSSWTVTHNLSDTNLLVEVFDLTGKLLWPDTITNTDANTTVITFVSPTSGRALLVHAGTVNIATNQPNAVISNPSGPQTIGGDLTVVGNLSVGGIPGNIAFAGNNSHSGSELFTSINNVIYADQQAGADACAKINAAGVLLPSTGGTINALGFQGAQLCASNPFASLSTKPIVLLLGHTTITTTAMWQLEQSQIIIGSSRTSTQIKADPTFNFGTNKAVVKIGSTNFTPGARVENLSINCNSISAGVGLYSAWADEQSGPIHVLFQNCAANGIWWETNGAANSFWKDVEIIPGSAGVTTTVPALVDDVKGFRGAEGLSVNAVGYTSKPQVCIKLNNSTTGLYFGLHGESCVEGVDVGFSTGSTGLTIASLYCQATVTDCVRINGPDTPRNSVVLMAINPVGATNTINDIENSKLISGGLVQSFYAIGPNPFVFLGAALQAPQLISASLGASAAQQHVIPAVASDTFALLSATQSLSNKTINAPFTNGTGLQFFNTTTTCTTAASAGAACTTGLITLPVAEADTSYRIVCTGKGITNVPTVIAITNSSATQFTITIAALTAAAATFNSYDCILGHN